jgi:putative drug exporter of the RND superfamily
VPKFFRIILPAVVVLVWLAGTGVGGPFFGLLAEVQSTAATDFLPANAESTRALDVQAAFGDGGGAPAIVVIEVPGGAGAGLQAELAARLDGVRALAGVAGVSPLLPSSAGGGADAPLAFQAFVAVDGEPASVVAAMRGVLADLPAGATAFVTGPAGFVADLVSSFGAIDGILLVVTVVAVLVILLVVYRSPVLPLLVLLASVAALANAVVAVYFMADRGWITLNGQAQGILFILVIGAATDYSLLLVARFREALRGEDSVVTAVRRAWRGAFEPVLASGGTVIGGVLVLLLSDLNSNKALGPVAAVGIAVAMAAVLTFLPALLALFGRAAFWPFPPRRESSAVRASPVVHTGGIWAKVAALVARRPRTVWVATALVLLGFSAFAPLFDADGVAQTDVVLGATESRAGQEVQARYFEAGAGAPAVVYAAADRIDALVAAAEGVPGVAAVAITRSGFGGPPASRPVRVEEADGRSWFELQATLADAPDGDAAIATVAALRTAVQAVDAAALVGGPTATDLDTRATARADLWRIIPIVLLVITAMLMVLLRSVIAPLLLMGANVLSFFATLGIAGLVFEHVFGFPGADPVVPLFAFVFLVALGIDYTIFLVSRIREETPTRGTRWAVLVALRVTGGVITSAGVVLAATFAALAVIPLLFLAQIAFLVAFGVLLDALVVRSLLVPGLFFDIGKRVWWPSGLARRDEANLPVPDGRLAAAAADRHETRGSAHRAQPV